MDPRVLQIGRLRGPAQEDAAGVEGRFEREQLAAFAVAGRFRGGGFGLGGFLGGGDLCAEDGEGGVGGGELEPAEAGVGGGGEVVEGEEGGGRAVVGFYVGGVEAQGGGAVEGAGAVVFWGP